MIYKNAIWDGRRPTTPPDARNCGSSSSCCSMYTTRLPPYRRTDGVAHNSKSMWSTWPQSRGVKQQYFDEKEGGQTELKLSNLSWPQKTKGDRLLAVYVLNNKIPIVWRRKRIRINSSNLFDHFSCLECSSSTFAIIQISQRAPHSSAAIGRDFVLLVLYSILHNSRRLASYLLYAGPSTSCFLQGVREQREGEAKGKLKRSARIYSRPDRGQKGEPCRPFSSRREHAKHITSWQGKWNQVK